jgi:preprotein translocase subunit SecD
MRSALTVSCTPRITVDGIYAYWVTDPVSADFRVVSTQPVLFSPTGGPGPIWGVMVTLDPSGVKALADYSAQFAKKPLAVMIDGAVATSMTFGPPITDGKFGFEAGSTRAQAALLAGFLETQGPADLEGAIVSVSTR